MAVTLKVDVGQLAAAKVGVGSGVLCDCLNLLKVGTEPVWVIDATFVSID